MDTAAPQQETQSTFMKFLKGAGSATKLAAGAGTVALGLAFVTGLPLVSAALFGGIALVAGGRQAYQGGKELFGKADDAKPGWKTRLGRAADSLGVGWTGALSFFIGGFALGMGSTAALPAVLVLSGMALMTVGTAQLATHAFTAIRDTVKHVQSSKAAKNASPLPAPDLSDAPKVGALEAAPGFEKAAAPEAKVADPAPAPVNAPAPPRP